MYKCTLQLDILDLVQILAIIGIILDIQIFLTIRIVNESDV